MPDDAVLRNHERCRANLIEATLVMTRLQSEMVRTMADVREAALMHVRRRAELDGKPDRITELLRRPPFNC